MPVKQMIHPAGSPPFLMGPNVRRYANITLVITIIYAMILLRRPPEMGPSTLQSVSEDNALRQDHYLRVSQEAEKLDRKYVSRLISHAGKPGSAHQALRTGEYHAQSRYNATIVIGRMNAEPERVQWVYDKLLNIHEPQIYIVDDPTTSGPHLAVNHGREAAVYMNYIIDNYDSLHDITFFWHNDEMVWHNNLLLGWDSVETINRMDRDYIMRVGYAPSRCDHWPGCPNWIRFNPSKAENGLDPHKLEDMFVPELFSRLFPDAADYPPYFAGTCCSQFAVTRDTIRSRPIELYQRLLEWILEYQYDDRSGMVFEYTWPYIFLNKGNHCPAMEECYCKTYNFCMENPDEIEQLDNWNGLRSRREEVKWQVTFMEAARDVKQQEYQDKGALPEEILAIETAFEPEIRRLSDDLDRLVNATWAKREALVHHWKLPVPPTGW